MTCRLSPPRGLRETDGVRGAKPATKEAFPTKHRSRRLATTGPLSARRVQASWKSFSLFFGGILAVAQCSPATNRAPIHSVVRPPVAFPPGQRESGGKRPHKCHGESGCRGTGAPRRVERVIDVDLEPKQWSAPALPSNGVAKQRTAPTPWGRWATRRRGLRTSRPGLRPRRP